MDYVCHGGALSGVSVGANAAEKRGLEIVTLSRAVLC